MPTPTPTAAPAAISSGWQPQGELVGVPCAILRGGTSKAVFLDARVVPTDPDQRVRFLLALMGSPDPRQIDGLGGADLLTSKVAIIGPPSVAGADLDYTFAQVSLREPRVDFDMNCGNISAAVGVYAVEAGLVPDGGPLTTVRIHNTNTRRILFAEVPVVDGHARVDGAGTVDGVPGSGAEILLDFRETVGGVTGRLLPTGAPRDRLQVPGLGTVEVSLVDIANLCVVVRAADMGLTPESFPGVPSEVVIQRVDALQRAAARSLGLPERGLVPIPVLVGEPRAYATLGGDAVVTKEAVDIVAEVIGGQPLTLHRAFPGTASITVAIAARIPGTVAPGPRADAAIVRIGHPSGRIEVQASVSATGPGEPTVRRAAYTRTARRLMEGVAFLRHGALATS